MAECLAQTCAGVEGAVSGRRRVLLAPAAAAAIRGEARAAAPEECCGILGGVAGPGPDDVRIAAAVAVPNRSPGDRRRHFLIEPEAILLARRALAARGLGIVGFYHSHPRGPQEPSPRDAAGAWPDASCLVASFEGAGGCTLRSFRRCGGGDFAEEQIVEDRG